jgi:hypothetical protein
VKNTYGEELVQFAVILDCGHYEYTSSAPWAMHVKVFDLVGTERPCKGSCAYRPEFAPNGKRYPYRTALKYPTRKVVAVKLAGTFEEDHAPHAGDAA